MTDLHEKSPAEINHPPDYDAMAHANYWHPEALFGLCLDYLKPGERLLDLGIGTGLGAAPFASFGLRVTGMDSSAEMLALCREKRIAEELKEHDLLQLPWPFAGEAFDHAIALGVLHFLPDLEPVFAEAGRLLRQGGTFTFTTKAPARQESDPYEGETIQNTTLYLHRSGYLERVLAGAGFVLLKELHLLVRTGTGAEAPFYAFVTRKS